MPTAIIIAPGRGSYTKKELGTLSNIESTKLDIADHVRQSFGKSSIRDLDSMDRYSTKFHVAGEHASTLTAAYSMADFDQISEDWDIVAVCGNSMGHYTALGLAGALPLEDSFVLIETMGSYQADGQVGGQMVYPLIDDQWVFQPEIKSRVDELVKDLPDLHISIDLGSQIVLGGSRSALNQATELLPTIKNGAYQFPMKLPLHSAFHTPLMERTARAAQRDLERLSWQQPCIPIIDGHSHIWKPFCSDLTALKNYTLGPQVLKPYNFTQMIRTAIRHFAPDNLILLGPGGNLGKAIAHAVIAERWKGISSKKDFLSYQESTPFLLSMNRSEQRSLVLTPLKK